MQISKVLIKNKSSWLEMSTEDAQALMFTLEEMFRTQGENLATEGKPALDKWVYFPSTPPLSDTVMVVKHVSSYFETTKA